MRVGKLFHLTPLVDDLADAERFFNGTISPVWSTRGYAERWHSDCAVYVIAETSIEAIQPLPPREGEPATSWYRLVERYGPHVHGMAFYVDDVAELDRRLQEAGVRTTYAGTPGTVFTHPKDTPGMLEFHDPGVRPHRGPPEPRFSPQWAAFRDDFWPHRHPLGLERLSHLTVVVHDVDAATRFYTDVVDAVRLDKQPPWEPDADSAFVMVGEDTVVELVHPHDPASRLGRELGSVGECVIGVTFKVRDVDKAASHLEVRQAPVVAVEDHRIVLDRTRTWGAEYRFTDEALRGDPRV